MSALFAQLVAFWQVTIGTTSDVKLTISSDTILAYATHSPHLATAWETTGNYLTGLTAYAGVGYLGNNASILDYFVNQLNINVIGFGIELSSIFPSNTDDAIKCCNDTASLSSYIDSGDACVNYNKNTYDAKKIFMSDAWLNNSNLTNSDSSTIKIIPFLYLREHCNSGDYPQLWHCLGTTPNGGGSGVPNIYTADELLWWQLLFLGSINCTYQMANKLNNEQIIFYKYHIWNEPNAHWWNYGKNGTDYAYFFYQISKLLKENYPKLQLSGPVTWDPPSNGNTWEDYYLPLFKMNRVNSSLLSEFDFHAYNNLSHWDYILSNINAINIYNWIYNGYNIQTDITETNQILNNDNNNDDDDDKSHWIERSIVNSMQIIAISHFPNKLYQRHTFDLNASSYRFWNSIDYRTYQILGNMQASNVIKHNLTMMNSNNNDADNDAFFVVSSKNIMSQVVKRYDLLYIYLINGGNENVDITIVDDAKILLFNTNNKNLNNSDKNANIMANYNSLIYNKLNFTQINDNTIKLTLQSYSIYQITAQVKSSHNDPKFISNIEYNCDDESTVMIPIISSSQKLVTMPTCNILFTDDVNGDNNYISVEKGYFRLGLIGTAAKSYTWYLNATLVSNNAINPTNQTFNFLQTLVGNKDSKQYNEIVITNREMLDFIDQYSQFIVNLYGVKNENSDHGNGIYGSNIDGRLAFISLVLQ